MISGKRFALLSLRFRFRMRMRFLFLYKSNNTALKILHEKFCGVKKNLMRTNIVYRNLINCHNAGIILLRKKGREIANGVENWN